MSSERYVLGTQFYMPVGDGHKVLAIAVPFKEGKILQSLYTLMMQAIVIEIWTLVVLAGMAAAWKGRELTHNQSITNVAIWNLQSSPVTVAKTMFDHMPYVPGYALLWMSLAILTVVGSVLLSTFVTPLLIAGQAAPANPDAVFAPGLGRSGTPIGVDRVLSPASMRALSALDAIDPATGGLSQEAQNKVSFTNYSVPNTDPDTTIIRLDWTYNVSGVEFGLQHVPGLIHTAQGSCYTEYSWYNANISESTQSSDQYEYSLSQNETENVSVDLSASAKALNLTVFNPKHKSPNPADTNVTFAFLPSSANKLTFSKSGDPWYSTGDTTTNIKNMNFYQVQRGRPMLSCWQSDNWTVGDHTTSTRNLRDLNALPIGLINVLQASLSIPRIISLTQTVGTMALKSSFGMQGRIFDAESASMASDIERLVLGAYIATKNVFLDATLFDHGSPDEFKNLLFSGTDKIDPRDVGAGDFIIHGTNFMALRISMLIAVPVILMSLFLLVMFLTDRRWFSWPWSKVYAMDATILYNNMMDHNAHDGVELVSSGTVTPTPLREVDGKIILRPTYDRCSSSYGWRPVPTM